MNAKKNIEKKAFQEMNGQTSLMVRCEEREDAERKS